jgi:hypothetical protein
MTLTIGAAASSRDIGNTAAGSRSSTGWGADDDEPEQCLGQRRRDGGW